MTTWNRDDTDLSTLTGIASTTVGSLRLTGTTIGHISDTDILNFSSNQLEIKASNIHFTNSATDDEVLSFTLSDDIQISAPEGNMQLHARNIELNANLGTILLIDDTVTFGSLSNSGTNNLLIKSGTTTAVTFSGANSQWAGTIQCAINSGDGSSENFVVEQAGLLLKRTPTEVRSDLGISDAEIIDWTTDQGGTNIHAGNYENTQLSTEAVQDIVGAMFSGNTETRIAATYEDGDGTIDLVVDDMTANTQLTSEEVQDIVGAMFTSNTETRISATYEDGDGTIDLVVDDMTANTQLSTEEVQDIVGAMFSGNTETRISATYQDGDGTVDLVVDDMSNVTGDNGNAAIYDNSGTPAFKSGITKAEVLSLLNVADGAEVNVNADWNSSSGDSQISNKPTLVTALDGLSDVTYSSGDLTISGLDKISSSDDLTLDVDGDIILDAEVGSGTGILLKDAGTTYGMFDIHHSATYFTLYEDGGASTNDYFQVICGANGATTIRTWDENAEAGHLTLNPDGDLILNPKEGKFIAQKDGTEFSAADSAYAGMILGYTRIQNLTTAGSGTEVANYAISIAGDSWSQVATVAGTKASITFVAPPSGNVEISFSARIANTNDNLFLSLSTSHSSYSALHLKHENESIFTADETDSYVNTAYWAIDGLTAGTSYTYYVWGRNYNSGSTSYIYHGYNYHHGGQWQSPPIIIKAVALPVTLVTGE